MDALIGLGAGIGLVALRWRSGTAETDAVVDTPEMTTEESESTVVIDKYRAQLRDWGTDMDWDMWGPPLVVLGISR